MGDKSKIEWTDATWNPVRGCSLVSDGCRNCYAMRAAHRLKSYRGLTRMTEHDPIWTGEVRLVKGLINWPLHSKKPKRIFVNSMSDLFHEAVPDEFIDDLFATMALCGQHIFQILTKRPEKMLDYMRVAGDRVKNITCDFPARRGEDDDGEGYLKITWPLPNVWLGVSVEDQKTADERIPLLLQTCAAIRWISAEPLLGIVDLNPWLPKFGINYSHPYNSGGGEPIGLDWVVCGGESGPCARPMHPDWVRSIRDQCQVSGVPLFFKQWGAFRPTRDTNDSRNLKLWIYDDGTVDDLKKRDIKKNGCLMEMVGKKRAGAILDGREWREMPNCRPVREKGHVK